MEHKEIFSYDAAEDRANTFLADWAMACVYSHSEDCGAPERDRKTEREGGRGRERVREREREREREERARERERGRERGRERESAREGGRESVCEGVGERVKERERERERVKERERERGGTGTWVDREEVRPCGPEVMGFTRYARNSAQEVGNVTPEGRNSKAEVRHCSHAQQEGMGWTQQVRNSTNR